MLTYPKEIQENRLIIRYDLDSPSPREDDNAGYFYTKEDWHKSPDGDGSHIYDIMIREGQKASGTQDHIARMTEAINTETDQRVMAIFPINRYKHSNVVYKLGTADGFDYSNCGFYIITDQSQAGKTYSMPWEEYIKKELDAYNAWVNGEIYCFTLYDENGVEVEDGCGFGSLEQIRELLPEEWQSENLNDYLIS